VRDGQVVLYPNTICPPPQDALRNKRRLLTPDNEKSLKINLGSCQLSLSMCSLFFLLHFLTDQNVDFVTDKMLRV
jgi:hypothetical protein